MYFNKCHSSEITKNYFDSNNFTIPELSNMKPDLPFEDGDIIFYNDLVYYISDSICFCKKDNNCIYYKLEQKNLIQVLKEDVILHKKLYGKIPDYAFHKKHIVLVRGNLQLEIIMLTPEIYSECYLLKNPFKEVYIFDHAYLSLGYFKVEKEEERFKLVKNVSHESIEKDMLETKNLHFSNRKKMVNDLISEISDDDIAPEKLGKIFSDYITKSREMEKQEYKDLSVINSKKVVLNIKY